MSFQGTLALDRHTVLHKLQLANRVIQPSRGSIRFLCRPIEPSTAFLLGSFMGREDQLSPMAFAPEGLVNKQI